MKFGVGKNAANGEKMENGILFLRKPSKYNGFKGYGKTNTGIEISWFEVHEKNILFSKFAERAEETWNTVFGKVLQGIIEKEGIDKKDITSISVRMNIRANAIEITTKDKRFIYYEFSSGCRRVIVKNKKYHGLKQLLRAAEVNQEIPEFPESPQDISVTIKQVKVE